MYKIISSYNQKNAPSVWMLGQELPGNEALHSKLDNFRV